MYLHVENERRYMYSSVLHFICRVVFGYCMNFMEFKMYFTQLKGNTVYSLMRCDVWYIKCVQHKL